MAFLTVFSVPKPFVGHIGVIQRNAIKSWALMAPDVEVRLYGDEEGVAEAAAELKVQHVPQVTKNQFGTPLITSVFEHVGETSNTRMVCFVNADVILPDQLVPQCRGIDTGAFLLVGQRWDLDVKEDLDLADPTVRGPLWSTLSERGKLHAPAGSDYFVFPRGIDWGFPPFAVGRPGWDNWLIYRARAMGVPVIDATPAIRVIHQNHDYSHLTKTGEFHTGPEAVRNTELAGAHHLFTLADATHRLTGDGLEPTRGLRYLRRRLLTTLILSRAAAPVFRVLDPVWYGARKLAARLPSA
ncbi:MAG TPA: hypothetical protein VNV65_02385 [Candidatus Solibacter sp.]|nr:hypothetical protein [Candidatus Solibacter sp.]